MQFNTLLATAFLAFSNTVNANDDSYLSMLGNAHLRSSPEFEILAEQLQDLVKVESAFRPGPKKGNRKLMRNLKSKKSKKSSPPEQQGGCDPDEDVVLADFEQWRDETGYWIGEYSFYGPDGSPNVSASWPYPYGSYKGFITGNVEGNKYRQRNVFLYPPQDATKCDNLQDSVGDGVCGINGNTKIFEADQAATKCDNGNIEGPFISVVPTYTYTTLIGDDNAVLYQVYMPAGPYNFGTFTIELPEDRVFQSQLTTITKSMDGSQIYRTRTAQGFDSFGFSGKAGASDYASYYREKKVSKEDFYEQFESAKAAYNIRDEDMCKWNGNNVDVLGDGVDGSIDACVDHLEASFLLL